MVYVKYLRIRHTRATSGPIQWGKDCSSIYYRPLAPNTTYGRHQQLQVTGTSQVHPTSTLRRLLEAAGVAAGVAEAEAEAEAEAAAEAAAEASLGVVLKEFLRNICQSLTSCCSITRGEYNLLWR